MDRLKLILDPQLGGKLRTIVGLLVVIAAWATYALDQVEAAGGVITLPLVLSVLTHLTRVGNAPTDES